MLSAIRANFFLMNNCKTAVWAGAGLQITQWGAACDTIRFADWIGGIAIITKQPAQAIRQLISGA